MSINVICSQCGASHHANDRMAGRRVRCPSCEALVQVPDAPVADPIDEPMTLEAEEVPEATPVETPQDMTYEPRFDEVPIEESSENEVMIPSISGLEDDEEDQVLERKERPEEEMDMTPMVDVTFLLLIFFMVTAAFSLQKSIEMPRQQTDAPSTNNEPEESDELDMVEVQIDEFGSFLVMAAEWERETPGKQNLISTLKEAAGSNNDAMRLIIKVHEAAKLHTLVDAMDAGTIAGYSELEVTQVEEFD